MWGWLRPLLDWLTSLIERKASQPSTMTDAKTPINLRNRWRDYLAHKLRHKDSGD